MKLLDIFQKNQEQKKIMANNNFRVKVFKNHYPQNAENECNNFCANNNIVSITPSSQKDSFCLTVVYI